MSHSLGEIWSTEGQLYGYFEYNGTSDIVCTRAHLNRKGVQEHWRGDNKRECTCDAAGQSVVLYTSYGSGMHWPGRVCWNCSAVTEGIQYEEATDGHPFFDEWMKVNYGQILKCPACKTGKLRSDGDEAPIVCVDCSARWYEWQISKYPLDIISPH